MVPRVLFPLWRWQRRIHGIMHGKRPEPACHRASACECWLSEWPHSVLLPLSLPRVFSPLALHIPHRHVSWCLLLSYTSVRPPHFLPKMISFIQWHQSLFINDNSARFLSPKSGIVHMRMSQRGFKQKSLSFFPLKLVSVPAPSWSHLVVDFAVTHGLHLGQETVSQIWPPVPMTMAGGLGPKPTIT